MIILEYHKGARDENGEELLLVAMILSLDEISVLLKFIGYIAYQG
jgi:hypothetical protein